MQITGFSFKNYKAFSGEVNLDLRPMTILIGRNNSGKSAIARFPLLMAKGLAPNAESPLELEFDRLDFGSSFKDIVHNHMPHQSIPVSGRFLSREGDSYEFKSRVQGYEELKFQVVTEFKLIKNQKILLDLIYPETDPIKGGETYTDKIRDRSLNVHFRGLLPQEIVTQDTNGYQDLIKNINELRDSVSSFYNRLTYLGPFRSEPQRYYRLGGGRVRHVGPGGARAGELLADDNLRSNGDVLRAVSDWFAGQLGGWTIDLAQQGDLFSIVMVNPRDPNIQINIADAGAGIAQVLPIVVQRQLELISGKWGSLEIVEQPELHLHPSAHGDLADLYIDAIKMAGDAGLTFLLETHSENFILRMRRRVAEGKLDPNQVIIYWVNDEFGEEKRIVPIEILQYGDVTDWPKGVFSEDFKEVRMIRKAQKERG